MSDKLYTQTEMLNLINKYNIKDQTTRETIKKNYIRILDEFNIQPKKIMELGYAKNNTYSWSTKASPNVPMFKQALTISVAFDFDVREFLKEV